MGPCSRRGDKKRQKSVSWTSVWSEWRNKSCNVIMRRYKDTRKCQCKYLIVITKIVLNIFLIYERTEKFLHFNSYWSLLFNVLTENEITIQKEIQMTCWKIYHTPNSNVRYSRNSLIQTANRPTFLAKVRFTLARWQITIIMCTTIRTG